MGGGSGDPPVPTTLTTPQQVRPVHEAGGAARSAAAPQLLPVTHRQVLPWGAVLVRGGTALGPPQPRDSSGTLGPHQDPHCTRTVTAPQWDPSSHQDPQYHTASGSPPPYPTETHRARHWDPCHKTQCTGTPTTAGPLSQCTRTSTMLQRELTVLQWDPQCSTPELPL